MLKFHSHRDTYSVTPLIGSLKACKTMLYIVFFFSLYEYIPREMHENGKFRIVLISERKFHWEEVLTILYNI